jgi:protein involved in ribonucleotide reduction
MVAGILFLGPTLTMTCKKRNLPPISFSKTLGGSGDDVGYSVQQTSDGAYIIAGRTDSYSVSGYGVWLVKVDATGNEVWNKAFGGPVDDDDEGWSARQTSDGGYIISGITSSEYSAGGAWLIKTDSSGRKVWDKIFYEDGGAGGTSVQQTSDGGYIVTGWANPLDFTEFWLLKTDELGNTVWDTTFGDLGDIGLSVHQTSDGGYIAVGRGGGRVLLLRVDASGNEVWDKTFGGATDNAGCSVQPTSDGGYVIAGWTYFHGARNRDVWLVKTDSSGNEVWDETFGGSGDDWGSSVEQTSDGGYVIAGSTSSYGAGDADVWLIKTDASGNKVWDKTFGGTGDDEGNSVQQTPDGGYIITGETDSYGAGGYDVWLIKTDAGGN